MAEIQLISATLVQAPATATREPIINKVELTSIDLKFLHVGPIQKGLLFLKPKSSSPLFHNQTLIQHLITSLSQTLHFILPLAGRLATLHHQDNTISFFIDCNNAGAQFVHAAAETVAVSDILESISIPPIVQSFFPLTGVKNYEGVSSPLLGVQITELFDGFFIGCTMNHVVGDGSTFWNFMNSWAEISRGLNQISKPPVFENWFRSGSIRLPLSVANSADEFTLPPLEERVFHFSKEKIGVLKAKANSELSGEENSIILSSLQSLLAHIWRAVIRNRQIEPDEETKFMLIIGFRRRLKPEIPDGYFGNAVHGGMVELRAREVMEKGIGFVALQLKNFVSGYTQEKVREIIDSRIKDPKILTRSDFTRGVLVTSSSPRFNVYGSDFGWGKPVAVRSGPENKFDGKITVFPGLEQGSMDVELCLSPQVLQAMGNDSEFMGAFT